MSFRPDILLLQSAAEPLFAYGDFARLGKRNLCDDRTYYLIYKRCAEHDRLNFHAVFGRKLGYSHLRHTYGNAGLRQECESEIIAQISAANTKRFSRASTAGLRLSSCFSS